MYASVIGEGVGVAPLHIRHINLSLVYRPRQVSYVIVRKLIVVSVVGENCLCGIGPCICSLIPGDCRCDKLRKIFKSYGMLGSIISEGICVAPLHTRHINLSLVYRPRQVDNVVVRKLIVVSVVGENCLCGIGPCICSLVSGECRCDKLRKIFKGYGMLGSIISKGICVAPLHIRHINLSLVYRPRQVVDGIRQLVVISVVGENCLCGIGPCIRSLLPRDCRCDKLRKIFKGYGMLGSVIGKGICVAPLHRRHVYTALPYPDDYLAGGHSTYTRDGGERYLAGVDTAVRDGRKIKIRFCCAVDEYAVLIPFVGKMRVLHCDRSPHKYTVRRAVVLYIDVTAVGELNAEENGSKSHIRIRHLGNGISVSVNPSENGESLYPRSEEPYIGTRRKNALTDSPAVIHILNLVYPRSLYRHINGKVYFGLTEEGGDERRLRRAYRLEELLDIYGEASLCGEHAAALIEVHNGYRAVLLGKHLKVGLKHAAKLIVVTLVFRNLCNYLLVCKVVKINSSGEELLALLYVLVPALERALKVHLTEELKDIVKRQSLVERIHLVAVLCKSGKELVLQIVGEFRRVACTEKKLRELHGHIHAYDIRTVAATGDGEMIGYQLHSLSYSRAVSVKPDCKGEVAHTKQSVKRDLPCQVHLAVRHNRNLRGFRKVGNEGLQRGYIEVSLRIDVKPVNTQGIYGCDKVTESVDGLVNRTFGTCGVALRLFNGVGDLCHKCFLLLFRALYEVGGIDLIPIYREELLVCEACLGEKGH